MTLLFADGFDGIEDWESEVNPGAYWDTWEHTDVDISTAYGRRAGSRGATVPSTAESGYRTIAKSTTNSTSIFVGAAINLRGDCSSATAERLRIIQFFNSTTPLFTVRAVGSSNRALEVRSGSETGTVLGTTTSPISYQSWVFIEIGITISPTIGTVIIKFDGTTVLNLSGLNTGSVAINSIKATLNGLDFTDRAGYWLDDVYICDGQGATNNTFLGDIRVDSYAPVSDGVHQDWTRSAGSNTWSLVDENPPSATDLVSGTAVGQKVTTKVSASDTGRQILGVVVSNISNETEGSGRRKVRPLAVMGGSTVNGTEHTLLTTYLRCPQVLEKAPDGTDWTYTKLNNSEFGLEVTA